MIFNNYSSSPDGLWVNSPFGIVVVKSNYLVKNMETKKRQLAKRDSAAIVLVFKAGAFATCGL